jgi:peptidoglycan hydrolase CwlO-like protein
LFFSPHFSTDDDLDKVDLDREANDRLIFYQQVEDSLITQKQRIEGKISLLNNQVEKLDNEIEDVQEIIFNLMTDLGYH